MGRVHEVALAADGKAFDQGIRAGVIKPLEDAEKALDELGRSRGPEQLESDIKDAQRRTEQLSDETKATARKIEQAYQSAGHGAKKGLGDGLSEAKDEARQSGREAAASFSGGFDDVGDFVQETLANAFGGLGPVGAAAGIALAAILGTVLSNVSKAQEKLAETREGAAELAGQLYESGGKLPITERVEELFSLLASERKARNPIENLIDDYVDLGTVLDTARTSATEAKVPFERLVSALSGGDLRRTKDVLASVNDELARIDKESGSVNAEDWQRRKDALSATASELEKVVQQTELADELLNSGDYLNAKRIEELGEAWKNASTDASNYFSETEDGATTFDWSTYLADAEATVAAANEMKSRLVGLPGDIRAEAERIFASQGAVAANEYTKAYEGASAADQGRFVSAAQQNGDAAGRAQAESMKNAFGMPEMTGRVRVEVDDSAWRYWRPSIKHGEVYTQVGTGIKWQ